MRRRKRFAVRGQLQRRRSRRMQFSERVHPVCARNVPGRQHRELDL
jgi:hypothetical protein